MSDKGTSREQGSGTAAEPQKTCGIVMPMSPMDSFPSTHWADVLAILESAIDLAGFHPRIVSVANLPSVIHKDIVHNLYSDPVVVCDVSGGNPNVMLEVGMRLAFDKPTIIVKDEQTRFNFDTSPLRQLEYPRDLRHGRIEDFKSKLAQMIQSTAAVASTPGYTSFLASFGPFKVAKLEQKEVAGSEIILDRLTEVAARLERLERALSFNEERFIYAKPAPHLTADVLAKPSPASVPPPPIYRKFTITRPETIKDSYAENVAKVLNAEWHRTESGAPIFTLGRPMFHADIMEALEVPLGLGQKSIERIP